MATYPLGIKRFTTVRDEVDIVRAEHMNSVQSEITAMQDTLGPNPHQDQESGWRWRTVKERLEYMIRGHQLPAFQVYNSTRYTYSSDNWHWATFSAPSESNDTHGAFSGGRYFKAPRAGWYSIVGQAYFSSTGLKGTRQLGLIYASGSGLAYQTEMYLGGTRSYGDWAQVVWFGRLGKGTSVGLKSRIVTGSYPNGKYTIQNQALKAFMVRDY